MAEIILKDHFNDQTADQTLDVRTGWGSVGAWSNANFTVNWAGEYISQLSDGTIRGAMIGSDPPTADYFTQIYAQINGTSSTHRVCPGVRGPTGTERDGYYLEARGDGTWELYRRVSGVSTSLISGSWSQNSSNYFYHKLQVEGTGAVVTLKYWVGRTAEPGSLGEDGVYSDSHAERIVSAGRPFVTTRYHYGRIGAFKAEAPTDLKQYGDTENFQIQWANGQWLITNDSKFAVAETINLLYQDATAPITITVTDTGSGDDSSISIQTSGSTIITVTDTGAGSDLISQLLNSLSVTDTGSGAETSPADVSAGVSDTGSASEAITNTILAAVTDAVNGSDSNTIAVQSSVTDSGTGTDSAIPSVAITITDNGSASDAINNLVPVIINETANGLDAVAVTMAAIAVADSATAAEAEAIQHSLVNVTDSGAGNELVTLFTETLKTVLDSGLGTESTPSVSLGVISVDDVATALDVNNIMNAITITDFSGSSDAVISVLRSFLATVTDSATGTDDVANVIVGVEVADVATATDLISGVMASLSTSDTGVGSDTVIRFVPLASGTYLVQFVAKAKSFGLTGKALNFGLKAK